MADGGMDAMAMLTSMAGSLGSAKDKEDRAAAEIDPRKRTPEQRAAAAAKAQAKLRAVKEATKGSASDDTICTACGKTVFAAERRDVEIGGAVDHYHEHCFKCADCAVQLKISTYVSVSRVIYCKSHAPAHRGEAGNAARVRAENLSKSAHDGDAKAAQREERERQEREQKGREIAARMRETAGTGTTSSCKVCAKRVYPAERIAVQVVTYESAWEYHKGCFRCTHEDCGIQLNLRNYSSLDGKLYCQAHAPKQEQAKEGAYFVSPLREEGYEKPEGEEADAGANDAATQNSGGDADLDLAQPGESRADRLVSSSSARILERAESAVREHKIKETAEVLADEEVGAGGEDDSEEARAEERARRREQRRKELAEQLAREEEEAEKRRAERRARRQALEGGDDGDSSRSERRSARRTDSGNDLEDFERRKEERRQRLAELRKG